MPESAKPCPALLLAALALLLGGCFPRQAGPRLAHFPDRAPAVGTVAPDFELPRADGGGSVRLADLLGDRPVVLQLGSHSCPVYRYRRHWMDGLWEAYGGRVHFLIVYTTEAHPVGSKSPYADGEWDTWFNRLTGVRVREPADFEDRCRLAETSHRQLELAPTLLVDTMDDAVWRAYGAASSPAFVLDRHGRVVESQVWIDPKRIRRALDRLLEDP